jgi:hypothetical protein
MPTPDKAREKVFGHAASAMRPIVTPTSVRTKPRFSIIISTLFLGVPSASRTPSSCVCALAMYDNSPYVRVESCKKLQPDDGSKD